jgi:eukaryotic-like serine/threonine-protein kinase
MAMPPESVLCPNCGSPVTSEAASGLCPACLLRTAAASGSADPIPALPRLRYFADYELLEEIARGGMGVVYKARQISLNRVVALKMMRPGLLATEDEVRRFHSEATAAAGLQHPNIVAIHEIGEQDGLYYFSMDYVEGASLAQVTAGRPLPERTAAEHVKTIAEAVAFAHQQGTLHLDLKPSNILIDLADRPRITDFGLARPLSAAAGGTASGVISGTPSYMAPEQAAGTRDPLTPAADVYSLGAILYESLTGRPPFQDGSAFQTLQAVLDSEPQRPGAIVPGLSRDLETICLKCLSKEPHRRYLSAQSLADDLTRFLRREPIAARRIGIAARAGRWCRRNPWQTTAAAALAIAAITLALAAMQARRSAAMLREQYWQSLLEQARLQRVTGHLAEAGRRVREAAAIRDNPATLGEAVELAVTPGAELLLDIPFGWADRVRFAPESERVAVEGGGYLGEAPSKRYGRIVKVWDVRSGHLVPGADREAERWMAAPPAPHVELPPEIVLDAGKRLVSNASRDPAALSADGRMFAAVIAHGSQGELAVWNTSTGRLIATIPDNHSPVWSASGLLASLTGNRVPTPGGSMGRDRTVGPGIVMGSSRVRVWRIADIAPEYQITESVSGIAMSPDGKRLAANGTVWEVKNRGGSIELARSATGGHARHAMFDQLDRLWESEPGHERFQIWCDGVVVPPHGSFATGFRAEIVEISPDGRRAAIAAAKSDGEHGKKLRRIELWDLDNGERISMLHSEDPEWPDGQIHFSPDGRFLAAAGPHFRPDLTLWDAGSGQPVRHFTVPFQSRAFAYVPGGDWIVSAGVGITISEAESGHVVRSWKTGVESQAISVAAAERLFATGGEDRLIHLWDYSGQELAHWTAHSAVTALAFGANGGVLFSGGEDGSLRVWDLNRMRAETSRLGVHW